MQEGYWRCIRCSGRKQMYRIGNIYSHTDTGGKRVDCPMCSGSGVIKTIDSFAKNDEVFEQKTEEKRKKKSKRKEVIYGDEKGAERT